MWRPQRTLPLLGALLCLGPSPAQGVVLDRGDVQDLDNRTWPWGNRVDMGAVQEATQAFITQGSEAMKKLREAVQPDQSWVDCVADMKRLWNGYISKNYEPGSFIWVYDKDIPGYAESGSPEDSGGDTYQNRWNSILSAVGVPSNLQPPQTMAYIKEVDKGKFWFHLVDDDMNIMDDELYPGSFKKTHLQPADSLSYLVQAIKHLPCIQYHTDDLLQKVTRAMSYLYTAGEGLAEYVKNKVQAAMEGQGALTLDIAVGMAYRSVLPHSIRAEGGLSLVVWPWDVAGTVFCTICGGKDTNRYGIDFAVGLSLGMSNDCFNGKAASVGLALQGIGASGEIGAAMSIAMGEDGRPEIDDEGYWELDGIGLSGGLSLISNDAASAWNPFSNWVAGTIVMCKDTQIIPFGSTC